MLLVLIAVRLRGLEAANANGRTQIGQDRWCCGGVAVIERNISYLRNST